MRLQRMTEKLDACGATYDVLDEAEEIDRRSRWREVFAKTRKMATGEWVRGGFDWHVFSDGLTPCLSEARALEAYASLPAGTVWILSDGPMAETYAIRATFAVAPLANLQSLGDDVLVVDRDFAWTLALTHEVGWCGPYFSTAVTASDEAERLA